MNKQDREKLTEFINQNKQRVNIYGSGREKEYEAVRVDALLRFIEPKYRVSLPIVSWDDDDAELKDEVVYLGYDITSDETTFVHSYAKSNKFRTELTEEEIKNIDERYWAFAVPAESAEVE